MVKVSSSEGEVFSIRTSDIFVPLDNIYDVLCEIFWIYIQIEEDLLDYCDYHRGDRTVQDNIYSQNGHKAFAISFKQYLYDEASIIHCHR